MIIARAPLRVSFCGGGTDIPEFYRNYGPGVVVSTSISRFVYVSVNHKFDGKVSVRYRNHEMTDRAEDIEHPLIREILLEYGVHSGIEIVISSEVPARGSGLGASSALAVALCMALERFTGRMTSMNSKVWQKSIADKAAQIEIYRVVSPIGKQDHYASALGGLNQLVFNSDETVDVFPYPHQDDDFYYEIEGQSMLFYMDIEHTYADSGKGSFVQKILKDQVATMEQKQKIHMLQRDNALALWDNMAYGVPERFIDHVNENWRLKRTIHEDISSRQIDQIVEKAYALGATAAKVCGAGGGGFLYLMVPTSMQDGLRKNLNLKELKFKFDRAGAQIVFEDHERTAHVNS